MDSTMIQTVAIIISYIVLATLYVAGGRASAKVLATKLEMLDATMEDVNLEIKELRKVVTAQAVQDTRITVMEGRMLSEGARLDQMSMSISKMNERLTRYVERGILPRIVDSER